MYHLPGAALFTANIVPVALWFHQYAYNSGLEVQGACYDTACDTAERVHR